MPARGSVTQCDAPPLLPRGNKSRQCQGLTWSTGLGHPGVQHAGLFSRQHELVQDRSGGANVRQADRCTAFSSKPHRRCKLFLRTEIKPRFRCSGRGHRFTDRCCCDASPNCGNGRGRLRSGMPRAHNSHAPSKESSNITMRRRGRMLLSSSR